MIIWVVKIFFVYFFCVFLPPTYLYVHIYIYMCITYHMCVNIVNGAIVYIFAYMLNTFVENLSNASKYSVSIYSCTNMFMCVWECVFALRNVGFWGINPFLKPFTGHITDQVKSQLLACCPKFHVVRPLPPSISSHFSEGDTVDSKRKSAPPEHLLQNWGHFSNYFSKSRC